MSLGNVVAATLLGALMFAPVVTIAQTGSPAGSESGTTPQPGSASATAAGSAKAQTASADKSFPTESQDESVIHARELRYERFFALVLGWHQSEKENEADGQKQLAEILHARLSKTTNLTDDEAEGVLQIVLQWREDVQISSRNALKVVGAVRTANPGVHMDHKNSPEIDAVYGQRWKITNYAIDELKGMLRAKSFDRLDHFTYHMDSYEKESN